MSFFAQHLRFCARFYIFFSKIVCDIRKKTQIHPNFSSFCGFGYRQKPKNETFQQLKLFFMTLFYRSKKRGIAAWSLLLLLVCVTAWAQGQPVTITGKVTDADNQQPLPGVTIRIEGTNIGTATDSEGNYKLLAEVNPAGYTLIASFIGYKTVKTAVTFESTTYELNFSLGEDILSLDEIIVTGLGTTSEKKKIGNLVSRVSQKDLKDIASPNAISSLSGRISGAVVTQNSGDPGGGFSVILRGISTVNGSAEPIFVVDGNIINNSSNNVINLNADAQATGFQAGQNRLIDINPNDIESIEVLKGASAAAVYGSLASNGVVLITTKKASSGAPKITFSTSVLVSELRKEIELNQYPFRFGYPGDSRLSTTGDRLTMIGDFRSPADRAALPGTGPIAGNNARLVENQYPVTRYNYWKDIFKTATGTDNYISVTGGGQKTSYFASVSYYNNDGILKNTNFERYGLNLKVDQRLLNDRALLSAGLIYSNSSSRDMPNGNNFFNPISGVVIIDNVWNINERDAFGNLLGTEILRINPLTPIETFNITQQTNRTIGNLNFNYSPIDDLIIDYRLGIDNTSLVGNTLQPTIPYPGVSAGFFPDGYASVATSNTFQLNSNFSATYSKKIGEQITTSTSIGAQWLYRQNKGTIAQGRDLLPFVNTINAARNFFVNPSEDQREFSLWGFFVQETIGYKNFAYLTLAGRVDGASSFGEDQRNQFYPKVSTSLVFSDLEFWKTMPNFWNSFKLRGSYGEAGNLTAIGEFDRFTVASPVVLPNRGGFVPSSRIGQTDIRPERQREYEVGADLSFIKNRLGIQFTYYSKTIDDLILTTAVPPTSGGTDIIRNAGQLENSGIELQVDGSIVKTRDFSWSATGIFSTFKNEITDLLNKQVNGDLLRGGGGTQSAIIGQPIGAFNVNFYARNADGSLLLSPIGLPQVDRGDPNTNTPQRDAAGQPSGTPIRRVLGDPNPDWTGSIINNFSYKRFSLRVQFDAIQGFEVYNWNKITLNNVGASKLSERELRGELPRGWVAAIGGFIGPRIQEEHIEDGSFVKLREVALTYDFGKIGLFSNINFTVIGRNLLSFDNYSGFDPETNSAGQNTRVRGDDFGNVPIPRTYQFKLTASF